MQISIDVRGLNEAIRELGKDLDAYQDVLTTELRNSLVKRTPIDSGKARRGWKEDKNSVSNTVPYIQRLEQGWSSQAPRGFVKQSVRAAIDRANTRFNINKRTQ